MESIRNAAGIISTAILAIINALLGLAIDLPQGVDAEGVALLNAAVLAVGALVVHFIKKPAAPVDPVA